MLVIYNCPIGQSFIVATSYHKICGRTKLQADTGAWGHHSHVNKDCICHSWNINPKGLIFWLLSPNL